MMKATVVINLKSGVHDPQGRAVGQALSGLGFDGVSDVRQGKVIELTLDDHDPAAAKQRVDAMCRKLLANPVIENYRIDITG